MKYILIVLSLLSFNAYSMVFCPPMEIYFFSKTVLNNDEFKIQLCSGRTIEDIEENPGDFINLSTDHKGVQTTISIPTEKLERISGTYKGDNVSGYRFKDNNDNTYYFIIVHAIHEKAFFRIRTNTGDNVKLELPIENTINTSIYRDELSTIVLNK